MKVMPAAIVLFLAVCSATAQSGIKFNVTDVVVYPQGTAFIHQDAMIRGGSSFSTVLPGGVYVESLRVTEDGGVVSKVKTYEDTAEASRLIHASQMSVAKVLAGSVGSQISFETEYGEYSGRLSSFDEESGLMVLEAVNYSIVRGGVRALKSAPYILMSSSQILEMVLTAKPRIQDGTISPRRADYNSLYQQVQKLIRLDWEDQGGAERRAQVSYLSSGVGWTPIYHLELPKEGGQARLSFIAQVSNLAYANYTGVRLRLVGGNINIRYAQGYQQSWDTNTQSELNMQSLGYIMPSVSYQPQRLSVDEYEVYDFPKRQDLTEKSHLLLPIYDGPVEVRREYVWDARSAAGGWQGYSKYDSGDVQGKVQNIYLVKNMNRTWPYGTVSVYQGGLLIGQDTIMWTPQGSEAKVTVGFAPDIEVKRRETVKAFYRQANYNEDYAHEAHLTLKNRKATKAFVTVMDEYPRNAHNFTASAVYSEEPGNLMKWKVELAPGEESELTYEYITE